MAHEPAVPLYQKLLEHYRGEILSFRLRPGDRVDSINEMQQKHRVARETAKRVLGILAQEGLIIQRAGKGSFVADLSPKKPIWGLIFPFYSIQYEDLIREVAHRAAAAGRELRHFCDYNNYQEETRLVGLMLKQGYEGLIVIPTMDESRTWEFYSRLSPQQPPVVLLDHTMSSNNSRYVVQSYDLGVTRALHYLLGRTRKAIAFVENDIWAGRNMVLELMRGTYLEVLRRNRPDSPPFILRRAMDLSLPDLKAHKVGALFCCDDTSAIQVIGRLREQGASVPGDFFVASYGNTDLSRFFTPAISSVDPRNAEMARLLGELLVPSDPARPIEGEHVILPEFIVRET